ncbi:MAG: flagellar biosynthesis protein FlhB [Pseudomonadales bacterium]|nr:flagellar biosynthesis protein FlhB [Pseudomonadales bacterium]
MAEDSDTSAEKSQEPTQKRLDEAREEGETPRSRELNTAAVLIAGSASLLIFGGTLVRGLVGVMNHNLTVPRAAIFDTSAMLRYLDDSVLAGFIALLPIFGVLLLAAILGPLALGGWNFSLKAIAPKFNRMNPFSGLARMFGPKALLELLKAVAKVLVVAALALLVLALNADAILGIQHEAVRPGMQHTLSIIAWSALLISTAMILITAIDIPIQLHQHKQKLMMTLQQVKDEMKDTDGRPEVKQRIRQLQHQMAQNRMMGDVPKADVVITNPEHFAVALRYDQGQESAPVVLAKGADQLAFRIREVAMENEVPVITSPALARAIYFNTDIGSEIPGGLYVAVAQVLAYIFQLNQYAQGKSLKPVLTEHLDIPEDLRHD